MNAPDLGQATDETLHGNENSADQRAHENDKVSAALNLVSEAAVAIKAFEEQSAQAIMRAQDVADAVREELRRAELRANRAETMLRLAEGQVEGLTADVEQARHDVKTLQALLAARESELASWISRAEEAEAAVQKIVEAIRTHLPVKLNVPTE